MVQFEESVCSETERICWHMMANGSSAALGSRGQSSWNCVQSRGRRWSTTQRPTNWDCASQPSAEPCQPSGTELSASQPGISNSHNAVEQANINAQVAARDSFPTVIGAIDCKHSAIKASSHDEFVTVNVKYFHSINVQIICDAQMQLPNIVARWPGSMHDSYILRNSVVGNRLQAGTVRQKVRLIKTFHTLRMGLSIFAHRDDQGLVRKILSCSLPSKKQQETNFNH